MVPQADERKVLVYDPYDAHGGAGVIQRNFVEIIAACVYGSAAVEILSSNTPGGGIALYFRRLMKVWKSRRQISSASLIITQGFFDPGSLLVGYLARKGEKEYYVIPRGDFVPTAKYFFVTRNFCVKLATWLLLGRRHISKAACVVVTSELEKRRLVRVWSRSDNIRIIPDPVYDGRLKFGPGSAVSNRDWATAISKPYALWLGRFAKEKGLPFLLDSWAGVKERNPDAVLLLVGRVFHRRECDRLMRKLDNLNLRGSVFVIDWVEAAEKDYLLANARCLVLPSFYESFGLVVVEALSHRTPIIVSDGTPWSHMDQRLGICIPRELPLWTDAMLRYLSAPMKADLPIDAIEAALKPYTVPEVKSLWMNLLIKYRIEGKRSE
jgi:glycosyltransferase involved in cell wall biosynthesis